MQFKENGLEMFPKHVKMSCITYATNCKKLHIKHNEVKLFLKMQLRKLNISISLNAIPENHQKYFKHLKTFEVNI